MRSTPLFMVLGGLTAVLLGVLSGSGLVFGHLLVMAAVWIVVAYFLGKAQTGEPWLARLMAWAMVAKLAGSWMRHFVLFEIYDGVGDAGRYHGFGIGIAQTWQRLEIPDMTTVAFGSEGTRFTAWITGLLYSPYEPSILGGFWMFALLAFIGQFFFYLAFRRISTSSSLKWYAVFIFFWPTLIYWPSSLGKEALSILFLGISAWAAVGLYQRYRYGWLLLIAVAAYPASLIRVHVAALFAVSVLGAVIVAKRPAGLDEAFRRLVVLVIGIASLIPLAIGVSEKFEVDLGTSVSVEDLDPLFSDVEETTGQGGSAVSAGAIRTPADIPAGILKVLFRPLPTEAHNVQMLAASLEGGLLLALVIWRFPKMLSNWRRIRRSPYLTMCLIFTLLFIWAWSSILNLGIMARQRSLVLPFLFVLIAALGWDPEEESSDVTGPDSHADDAEPIPQRATHPQLVSKTNAVRR